MIANTPAAWSDQALLADPCAAARWSAAGQRDRFAAALAALDPQDEKDTVLDFGCGTGELCEWLSPLVGYLGYDWASGMIERARADHPSHRFTDSHPTGHFDVVACVGPFNLRDGWSKQLTWFTLRHLWDTASCRALAVSLYAGEDEDCLIYTLAECVAFGGQLGYDVTVTRIRANDLLLVARR